MNLRADTCIIGGGVMGLGAAYYLTKAGKDVVLLEKTEVGSGASGACDDMILMQSKKPGIALTLALESLEIYKTLPGELGTDIGFENRGGMVLIEDDKQLKVMEHFVEQQTALGLEVEIVGRDVLKKKQPHVSDAIIASTYSRMDSQVDPFLMMHAFLHHALNRGLRILRPAPAQAIERKGDHWLVEYPDGKVECDSVLIAAGAWSGLIAGLCDVEVPIKPVRGQLAITEQIPAIGETNNWTAAYIASKLDKSLMPDKGPYAEEIGMGFSFGQAHDGNYLIGSTREDAGFDKTTYERAISMLVKQARTYFPVLNNVSIIRTIAGFRPGTPDSNPIVGPIDGRPGLFIASGHEGDGVALAPVTGKAVADMILGRHDDKRFDLVNLRRFGEAAGTINK